jgi:hypothetical protein
MALASSLGRAIECLASAPKSVTSIAVCIKAAGQPGITRGALDVARRFAPDLVATCRVEETVATVTLRRKTPAVRQD